MRENLKDRYGMMLGYYENRGGRKELYDKYGLKLGYYDGKYTYDRYGMKVGEGDLLAMLLR